MRKQGEMIENIACFHAPLLMTTKTDLEDKFEIQRQM